MCYFLDINMKLRSATVTLLPMRLMCSFLFLSIAVSAQNSQLMVTVESFGAVANGWNDDTQAINAAFAFATSHQGTRLLFSCQNVTSYCTYVVTQPLSFPAYTTIESTNPNAVVLYAPTSQPNSTPQGAFQITNAGYTTIRNIGFRTGPSYPPASVLFLARTTGNAEQNNFQNVAISGYATKAMVYSISSEINIWSQLRIENDGGGALYGFYTSGVDDLGICSPACSWNSNLSLYMSDYQILGYAGPSAPFIAIADALGGGTGDHYYRNGYIGLNQNVYSVGAEVISGNSSQGGPNTVFHLTDTRTENGGYGIHFKKNSQSTLYNIHIDGYTFETYVSGNTFFAYGDSGLMLSASEMRGNIGKANGITANTSIDSLQNSMVWENYGPITIRTSATGNVLFGAGATSFNLPAGGTNFVVKGGLVVPPQ